MIAYLLAISMCGILQCSCCLYNASCFFFSDTATTEFYTFLHTLSLHDSLPICSCRVRRHRLGPNSHPSVQAVFPREFFARDDRGGGAAGRRACQDRKSTRLNSSH